MKKLVKIILIFSLTGCGFTQNQLQNHSTYDPKCVMERKDPCDPQCADPQWTRTPQGCQRRP